MSKQASFEITLTLDELREIEWWLLNCRCVPTRWFTPQGRESLRRKFHELNERVGVGGYWCQNCSLTLVEKQGGICRRCEADLGIIALASNAESAHRYNVLKRLVETKRHVYITTTKVDPLAARSVGSLSEVEVVTAGLRGTGTNLDAALDLVESDLENRGAVQPEADKVLKALAGKPLNPLPICPTCEGCGQVANTEDREPWTAWMRIELRNSTAVLLGFVKPIPCPDCGGSGRTKKEKPHAKPDPVSFDGGPHGLAGPDPA